MNAAQGSEFQSVIYVVSDYTKMYETCAALYTAITRGRRVAVCIDIGGVERIAARPEKKRQTLVLKHLESI